MDGRGEEEAQGRHFGEAHVEKSFGGDIWEKPGEDILGKPRGDMIDSHKTWGVRPAVLQGSRRAVDKEVGRLCLRCHRGTGAVHRFHDVKLTSGEAGSPVHRVSSAVS